MSARASQIPAWCTFFTATVNAPAVEFYVHKYFRLIYMYLFADCVMKISPQSSEQIQFNNRVFCGYGGQQSQLKWIQRHEYIVNSVCVSWVIMYSGFTDACTLELHTNPFDRHLSKFLSSVTWSRCGQCKLTSFLQRTPSIKYHALVSIMPSILSVYKVPIRSFEPG